jgi:hypothetical protein
MAVQHLQLETEAVEKQCRTRLVDDETEEIIDKDSSLTTSTDLYWSIKRFSHTDHNWSEEHPEYVIHKKSSLKMQKENAFTYECQ